MRVHSLVAGLFLASASLPASAALDGDAQHGEKLYGKYCAGQCHTAEIHQRDDLRATNQAEVVAWIQRQCSQAMAQNLSVQDIEDLATYLNNKYYHYEN